VYSCPASRSTFSIYVHIPYCLRKCPYCDFNSRAEPYAEDKYVQSLAAEAAYYQMLPEWADRTCGSVYFGGGTPTLFSAAALSRILSVLSGLFSMSGDAELSIEANPATLTNELSRAKLHTLFSSGFNRISLGAQSFSQDKLAQLGRIHSAVDVSRSLSDIRAAGFANINLDLIFGTPLETLTVWEQDLDEALRLCPQHLSVYGLTIEPHTYFAKRLKQGLLLLPDEDTQAKMFLLAQERLSAAGCRQYEISNYAQPGFECRHNIGYWKRSDYLGLGAGAHSFCSRSAPGSLLGRRWANIASPTDYMASIAAGGKAVAFAEDIDKEKAILEFFFLGLRKTEGISFAEYETIFGEQMPEDRLQILNQAAKDGLVEKTPYGAALTPRGLLLSDSVFSSLV